MELNDDMITCYFNNQQVFAVHDGAYADDQAGVYTPALGDVLTTSPSPCHKRTRTHDSLAFYSLVSIPNLEGLYYAIHGVSTQHGSVVTYHHVAG
jgi:hypothetical protein